MGALDMIHSFLNPQDAYKSAERASNRGYKESQDYQTPFFQQGVGQTGRLNDAENNLLDPEALQNKWGAGYEQSPYAQQQLSQNKTAGLDAASSMGLGGSSAAIGNIQQGAGNIMAKDREQYMKDLMEKYLHGIGLGTDIYSTGASAGQNLGTNAFTHGNDVAGLRYGRDAAPGKLFENLLKGSAGFAGIGSGGGFNQGVPEYMQNAIYAGA